jgi:DNA-binding transcriptional regulator GbsR (MarR family)
MPGVDDQQLLQWVERVAGFLDDEYGTPPITGRILGWLMVCDPPEQSGSEIAAAIGASRASISTNMRLLTGSGLVRRSRRAGGRTAYYRIDDDAWATVTRRRLTSIASFSELVTEGIDMLGPDTARVARLQAAREVYDWFAGLADELPGARKGARG